MKVCKAWHDPKAGCFMTTQNFNHPPKPLKAKDLEEDADLKDQEDQDISKTSKNKKKYRIMYFI
jgi:hypothetical protein